MYEELVRHEQLTESSMMTSEKVLHKKKNNTLIITEDFTKTKEKRE